MRPLAYLAVLFVALLTLLPHGIVMAQPTPTGITILLRPDSTITPAMLSNAEIARDAQALQDWAVSDVSRVWPLPPVRVLAIPYGWHLPPARPMQWVMNLTYTTGYCNAYVCEEGFHDITARGVPFGVVGFVDTEAMGDPFMVVLSHEVAEILVDPFGNRLAINNNTKSLGGWKTEIGDPVADTSYWWGDRGISYRMSNYAYPSEFVPGGRWPYDRLHRLTRPFSTTRWGYLPRWGVSLPTS